MRTWAAILCVSLSTICCAQTGDVVYVVDESVGMGPEHDWIRDFAVEVDTGLAIGGVFNVRYALVGFGAIDPAPYTIPMVPSTAIAGAAQRVASGRIVKLMRRIP